MVIGAHSITNHRPGIDGLRAVAIAAVLLFHGEVSWMQGGFLGVSLFFTLSGFLVTTLLLDDHRAHSTISLGQFWARRARRLLPSAWLTIAAVMVLTHFEGTTAQRAALRGDALGSLLHVANWRFLAAETSYDTQFGGKSALLHFWSLAIEEQFYLFWPLIVAGVLFATRAATRSRAALGAVVVGALAASVVASVLVVEIDRGYYGTDTRAAELLIGALLAIMLTPGRAPQLRRVSDWLAPIALVAFISACVIARVDSSWLHNGGRVLVAAGSAVLVAASWDEGWLARVLAWGPLPAIGRASYTLYLVHWPVFVFVDAVRTDLDGPELFAVRIAISSAITVAVYHGYECPLRAGRWFHRRRRIEPIVALGAVVALAAGVLALPRVSIERVDAAAAGVPTVPAPTTEPLRVLVVGADATAQAARLADNDRLAVTVAAADECPTIAAAATRRSGEPRPVPSACADSTSLRWIPNAASDADVIVLAQGAIDSEELSIDGEWTSLESLDTVTRFDRAFAESARAALDDGRVLLIVEPASQSPRAQIVRDRLRRFADGALGAVTMEASMTVAMLLGAVDAARAETVEPWPMPLGTRPPEPLRVLVVGDSTSFWIAVGLVNAGPALGLETVWAGAAACPIVRVDEYVGLEGDLVDAANCPRFDEDWAAAARVSRPDLVLVVASTIDGARHDLGDGPVGFGDRSFDEFWRAEAEDAIDALAASGAVVVWADAPTVEFVQRTATEDWNRRLTRYNDLVAAIADEYAHVSRLALADRLGIPGAAVDRGARPDGVHLSAEAATQLVQSWLAAELRTIWVETVTEAATTGCFVPNEPRPQLALDVCRLSSGSGTR